MPWHAEPDFWSWVLVSLLGGLTGVDAVSWPQVMVSRPIVSATIGGAVMGRPAAGLLAGALLELLALRHQPFGAARYPDTGPAGVVAGAAYAASGGGGAAALATAAVMGWALGWIGARTVHVQRAVSGHLLADVEVLAAEPRRLERRQRLAVGLDFARGALLGATFLVPAVLAVRLVPAAHGAGGAAAAAALAAAAGAGAGASVGALGRARGRWWLLAAGAALGGLTVWGLA